MITKRNKDGSWSASTMGALRPITVEAETRPVALLQLAEAVHQQEAEEYAMEQSMGHLADVSPGGAGAYGADLG